MIGIVISGLLLYLVVRKVDYHELTAAFRQANYLYLIPVVVLTLLSLFFRAWRWHYLLAPVERVGLAALFSATVIGLAANNLLPARLGEIVRAYALKKQAGLPVSASIATIIVERILDVFTLLGFLGVTFLIPLVIDPPGRSTTFSLPLWIIRSGYFALALNFGVMVVLTLLIIAPERSEAILVRLAGRLSERLGRWLNGTIHSFVTGLEVYRDWRLLGASLLLSLCVWGTVICAIYYAFRSFGLHLPPVAPIVVLVVLALGLMIPSAPGYVGTFQWFTVAGLSLFAVGESRALSFSIVFHATQFFPITLLGLAALYWAGMSLETLRYTDHREDSS
jgi:uncharacterized protein (TIRG00374 family)